MKVAAQTRYGGPEVLEIKELPKPLPKPGEVLVRVHACTVTLADCAFRKADPFIVRFFAGLVRPRNEVAGSNIAGVVEAVGEGVSRFRPGEALHGTVGPSLGGMAEYVCLPEESAIVPAPDGQSLSALAGLGYSYLTAMPFIRDEAKVKPGDKVLIHGAASSVGLIALQLAIHYRAEVTAVASGRHASLLRELGAHHIVDRHQEDFTTRREAYDVIFDAVGKSSFAACAPALKAGGIYLTTTPGWRIMWLMLTGGGRSGKRGRLATTGLRPAAAQLADLEVLNRLLIEGAVRPVTDRVFPLAEIAEAHRYVETERKAGDVVVEMPA